MLPLMMIDDGAPFNVNLFVFVNDCCWFEFFQVVVALDLLCCRCADRVVPYWGTPPLPLLVGMPPVHTALYLI